MNFTLKFMIKGPILLVVAVWTYDGMPSEYCHCCIPTPTDYSVYISHSTPYDKWFMRYDYVSAFAL